MINLIITVCIFLSYTISVAHNLPIEVISRVLEYGTEEEISFDEILEDDGQGQRIYEVKLLKDRHQLILLIDQEGRIVDKIKYKILISSDLLVVYHGPLTHHLPEEIMYEVLNHGTEEEISFEEILEDNGTGEKIYEVRLLKKNHILILLIDEEGIIVHKVKNKFFHQIWS